MLKSPCLMRLKMVSGKSRVVFYDVIVVLLGDLLYSCMM